MPLTLHDARREGLTFEREWMKLLHAPALLRRYRQANE
jgi:hypothetical protein